MAWAADNRISTSPIEGGIEITDEQYSAALQALLAGQRVVIEDGQMVLKDPEPPETPEPDPEPQVPQEVSKAQGLLAMYEAGLYEDVMTWVAADQRRKIAFDAITSFRLDSPLLQQGASDLELSQAQLEALFTAASQIQV